MPPSSRGRSAQDVLVGPVVAHHVQIRGRQTTARRCPRLRAAVSALRNTSGSWTAEPQLIQTPRDSPPTAVISRRKSWCVAAPIAAPSADGCACAPCPHRAPRESSPVGSAGGPRQAGSMHGVRQPLLDDASSRASRPDRNPRPAPRVPLRSAPGRVRPPCRIVPSASPLRTSSDVSPTAAISQSWIATAPLSARPLMRSRSSMRISTGASPTLIGCAPIAQ